MKKRMFSKFSSILQHAVDAVSVLLAGICANVSHPGGFVSGFLFEHFFHYVLTPVLCLGQYFWGTQVSLYLNFRGTFTKTGGHTKSFKFLPAKLNSYPEISVHFLFKFELDVDRFGSRRGCR